MKQQGRVVRVADLLIAVAVEGNSGASVAACCTVPSVVLEAKNPAGIEVHPGELVEVTDGLGALVLGGCSYLVFPGVLWTLGTALTNHWWVGLTGVVAGLFFAVLVCKSLKLDQFPRLVRRLGSVIEPEDMEKESL